MLKRLASLLLISLVAACGGGGGDAGSSPFGPGSGTGANTSTSSSGTSGVVSNLTGSVVMNISASVISSSAPGVVTALIKDAKGDPIVGTVVTFTVSGGIAVVSPATVLTDSAGSASTSISPSSQSALGAAYVSASADTSGAPLTAKLAFSVSAVNVTLDSLAASAASVPAYASTPITASVTGASSSSPVNVTFSSTCVAAGKASITPVTLSLVSASGSVTYQDKGCNSTDRVSASVSGTSQTKTLDLVLQAPASQAIQFVSATPNTICLAGSGCPAASIVSFKVTDQFGNPVASRSVDLSLDIPGVATLSFFNAVSDSAGVVSVSVLAKTIPTPVRVKAKVTGTSLETVSNQLSINAGLPTQQAVSFSATAYNIDGLDRDGEASTIRLQLNDRFGNPVPDGTAISLVAEGASVIPARCVTVSAVCTVQFVSSNFRPLNGRVTVIAFAQGEESFADADANNLYTSGEAFVDLGEVYVDKNENNQLDTGEFIAGSPQNGTWDGNTYVRATRVFVLASSATAPRLFEALDKNTCSNTPLQRFTLQLVAPGTCRAYKQVCVRDGNANADSIGGNPVPVGSILGITTKAKDVSISVDSSPVTALATRPTVHTITAELSDCTMPATAGDIDLQVQMPNAGPLYKFSSIGTVTP